jgi:Flp pilus assembly pilin Flp
VLDLLRALVQSLMLGSREADERGWSLAEYLMLAGLIAFASLAAATAIGGGTGLSAP